MHHEGHSCQGHSPPFGVSFPRDFGTDCEAGTKGLQEVPPVDEQALAIPEVSL